MKEGSEVLVYHIRSHGSTRRKIIAPMEVDQSIIEQGLKLGEYINECNTFLGYYGDDAQFFFE